MDHPPPPHGGPPPDGFDGGPPPGGVPGGPNDNTTVPPELRLLGAGSYLVFTLLSLTANFLLLTVFIKGRKKFQTMSFYIIAFHMLMTDFTGLLVEVVLAIPITFAGYDLYGKTFRYVVGFCDNLSFNGGFFFVFLLTINRLLTFFLPRINQFLFGFPNIHVSIVIVWLLNIGYSTAMGISGCWVTFNAKQYHIELVCSQNRSQISFLLQSWQVDMTMYIPIIMMVIYVILFIEIKFQVLYILTHFRRPNKAAQSNKKEFLILVQSIILCGIFFLKNLVLNFMPRLRMSLSDANLMQFITFAHIWVIILNNTVHAIVIFLFNSMAREVLWTLLGRKKTVPMVITKVSTIHVKPALEKL